MPKALVPLLLLPLLFVACAKSAPEEDLPVVTIAPDYIAASTPLQSPAPVAPTVEVYWPIDPDGETIATRFVPPPGFTRAEADAYGTFIREQPLLPDGSPVLLYNGEVAPVQRMHAAVLAIDVGERDLQQCADAALRLRCEYLFSCGDYDAIDYHLTNGERFPYSKYKEGYRLQVQGNRTKLVKTAGADESYETFRKYLDVLFNYASTRSLYKESTNISLDALQIGDLFLIAETRPGHCVIVMDMCENAQGQKAILVGQSSMPAQQIHIIQDRFDLSPWILVDTIRFPFALAGWQFEQTHVMRMP